jgi:hypothetical protein
VAKEKYLIKASSSDEVFRLLHDSTNASTSNERLSSCFCGAYVAGTNRDLLVGSSKELMYGVDVTFEGSFWEDYAVVMDSQ